MSKEPASTAERAPVQELGRGRRASTPLLLFLTTHLIVVAVTALIMVTILVVVLLI